MKVRIAKLQDAKAITGQNLSLAQESENIILKPKSVLAGVKSLLSDKKKGIYIVAEDKGVIVGQIMITVEWSDWRNKPIWWTLSVYVQKESRKHGVFTELLNKVQEMAMGLIFPGKGTSHLFEYGQPCHRQGAMEFKANPFKELFCRQVSFHD